MCGRYPDQAVAEADRRPLIGLAVNGDVGALALALREEELEERERDRVYWAPLKRELEVLRREERGESS